MNLRLFKKLFKGKTNYFIHKTAQVEEKNKFNIKQGAEIWEYVIIRLGVDIEIGEFSQIGPFCVIFGGNKIRLGRNVIIAPHCVIAGGNHDYRQNDNAMRFAPSISAGPIIIEDDVWIGANCTITDNVVIGKGAVIGANSVITKNVEPFSIVGGVPAKKIKMRFEND